VADKLAGLDWERIEKEVEEVGFSKTPPLLSAEECKQLIGVYSDDTRFRSRVEMARFRFGEGEYKYFCYPLPPQVEAIRQQAYPHLAGIAANWGRKQGDARGDAREYPKALEGFLDLCHKQGQKRPTPLLLKYEAGGYNCLHQDLYGDIAFPLQMTCVLSRPGIDYTGGELILVEQRPRAQSRAEAITLEQGEAIVFPNNQRPVRGAKGYYRVTVRHGVSRLLSGTRYSLGIIFHDAK
jgi:hypothetical protein